MIKGLTKAADQFWSKCFHHRFGLMVVIGSFGAAVIAAFFFLGTHGVRLRAIADKAKEHAPSSQTIPNAAALAVHGQVPCRNEGAKMRFERIAAGTGEFDHLADGHAAMFACLIDNLDR